MLVYVDNETLCIPFGRNLYCVLELNDFYRAEVSTQNSTLLIDERSQSMGKLERNRGMFFASFDNTSWEALGKDNDDLSKELNPDTETSKNVLGETTFKHNGYEPEISVDPYYAEEDSVLYENLRDAAIQELYSDSAIKGYFIETVFETVNAAAGTMSGTGYKREAYLVPQSIGGDTSSLAIPFTVNPVGPMTAVTVSYVIATRTLTVTPIT